MGHLVRIITGIVLIFIGIGLILVPFFVGNKVSFVSWIYGVPILIIGFFIFLNNREDEIEKRKDIKIKMDKI